MDANFITLGLIALLVGGIGYVGYLYKGKKFSEIYSIAKAFVNEAEAKFGSGKGDIKYEYVVGKLYSVIPGYIKVFISEELLDLWIETAVKELQGHLDSKIEK